MRTLGVPHFADMERIEELLPYFRSCGASVKWSAIYKDTLFVSTPDGSVYVTWEQVAYLADHGVRMCVFGFVPENLTKHKERGHNE